jgi:glycosyltransferase involved in cell wall biosynthesis
MHAPTVVLDATAVPMDRGGVGRYVDGLVAATVALGEDPVVVCTDRDAATFGAMGVREVVPAHAASGSRPARLVWEQVGLPRLVGRLGGDVVHSPHYTMPGLAGFPPGGRPAARVVTLHDATFFTDPQWHLAVKSVAFRVATRRALSGADRCLVPSTATLVELTRLVPAADPRRVRVVPHGVDRRTFRPPTEGEVDAFARRHGLVGRRWIAFLGTVEPRKNVGGLIRGWVRAFAADAAGDPGAAPALVLAGGSGWDDSVAPALETVPHAMTVLRPGYLPLGDLPALLGGAEVVAYPSLGEGFGLPVLEAMACGGCVLTTRRLSLPEVGGDAVEYCEPDPSAIAAALRLLLDDDARRARLRREAPVRAASFSWRSSAEAHLRVWHEAAGEAR